MWGGLEGRRYVTAGPVPARLLLHPLRPNPRLPTPTAPSTGLTASADLGPHVGHLGLRTEILKGGALGQVGLLCTPSLVVGWVVWVGGRGVFFSCPFPPVPSSSRHRLGRREELCPPTRPPDRPPAQSLDRVLSGSVQLPNTRPSPTQLAQASDGSSAQIFCGRGK